MGVGGGGSAQSQPYKATKEEMANAAPISSVSACTFCSKLSKMHPSVLKPISLPPPCAASSAAACLPTDPQDPWHGASAYIQGQRSQPQTAAGRQQCGRRRGGGQERQKGRRRLCLTAASTHFIKETGRMSQLRNRTKNNPNMQLHTQYIITDHMCYTTEV